ncbi:ubinuclein-2b isoform X1 [Pleuronectes platessa]|uniref:ubinuclein-2b isoform X1 n=1 Tax=Pleuronectes platessa TaxID=8262 RepID=UPI00232A0A02|nr:ubinuclein-2b isoform X1 [Pleuronectes platessa]
MTEPRKVPFVTISSFGAAAAVTTPESGKKRRREDEAVECTLGKDGGGSAAVGSGGGGGPFGTDQGADAEAAEAKPTVRLHLPLTEPNERGSAEFNYGELVNPSASQVKLAASVAPKGLTPPLDPNDPFADDEKERRQVEAMAKKFENKYGGAVKKKKKDRMQDLIDIGYGYDDTDPFIDNSEAYDELVPASLTTKHGGFYINTGTLQFRAASDSEGENAGTEDNPFKKMKDGEERVIKKRRKKPDGILEEKKPRKNKVPKPGGGSLNVHRPEKKKRKKLMKDSIHLANMLRRFTREKEEMRKKNVTGPSLPRPNAKAPTANSALLNAHPKAAGGNDCTITDLSADPSVMSLLGSTNNDILQDMMGDLDFAMLDSPQPSSPAQGENGSFGTGHKAGGSRVSQANMMTPPPPLPNGLPGPLTKRIEDLRSASRLFDEEGRKKFFTLDMNNILLDIELQVQEQPAEVRAVVYSHLEAFVPCNKEALLKRLKKLSLNIQDDRLRTPLLKLKLAVCSSMPEQIARYNMDCIAKVAKQQSGEAEKNGSEDEDEEKPGKRVMGPRKKFMWDDKLRLLLCNLVRVKLGCFELEGKNTLSLEDYLRAFMETEVKLLWPKGWMQARMLFKESIMAHGHLTGYTAKRKMVTTPRAKPKEAAWVRTTPSAGATPSAQAAKRPPQSPSEPICLDDDLTTPSLDSISQALAILGNAAKGLAQGDSPPSPDRPRTVANPVSLHTSPLLQHQQQKKNSVSTTSCSAPHYISTSSSSSTPLSRLPSITSSPLPSVRVDGMTVVKAIAQAQAQRHSVLNTPRPLGAAKTIMSASPSQLKPRPPPTASPLVAPGSKSGVSTPPSGLLKGSNNKSTSGDTLILTSPQSRPHNLSSPTIIKTYQGPRLAHTLQSKSSPSLTQTLSGAQAQPQSNFITPMHATLTKSTHSSIPPIVKLTARTPIVTTSVSPSISQNPRSQATPTIHQYSPQTAAGFRPQFSGVKGGVTKPVQGSYTPPGGQKTPNHSTNNISLINVSSISKHSGSSASPTLVSVNLGQRQRPGGVTPQGAKSVTSVSSSSISSQLPQVSTAGAGGLLNSASSLTLGYGILGGLVPVSLPFQFPPLLNLPPMGTAGSSSAGGSVASSNASLSTLTQNLYKSLQAGSQVVVPPHLQLAFSELCYSRPDVSQNQGGDAKRKNL